MGITASSMATMRPLFVAFFSRSKLFGSTTRHSTYPRNTSRLAYFCKNNDVEELELQSDLGRSIRVTTAVIKTESTRPRRDEEGDKNSTESKTALNGESKWGANLEIDNCENIGHYTTIEGGLAA
jgi:hypothetical protein